MKKLQNTIKYGNIFKLGNHYLANGDCRDKELVTKLVGQLRIKSMICDVPYGCAVVESKQNFKKLLKDKAIANDHLQTDEEYQAFTKNWLEAIKPYLTRKNSCYIFNSDKMVFPLREGLLAAGGKFGQLLIWVKTQAVIGRLDYAPAHELIIYCWFGAHEFNMSKDKSVLIYPRPNKSPLHPTTKPLGLIRRLVLNSTRIGDVVYDGFLGSGTTLLACEQTKRICLGVEIDPEYCQTVINQYKKLTNQKAKKLN
jgi:DNA modification methylase